MAARRSQVVMEKTVLTEFLQLYRSFPCLWDQKHMMYGNREARDKAYEVLLEKYKLVQDNAVTIDVKKRIEYMRCAYRREHKKVLMSKLRGGEYKPHLWYFDLLTFLNENEHNDDGSDYKLFESIVRVEDSSYQAAQEIDSDTDDERSKPKRRKRVSNAIYMKEEDNQNDDDDVVIEQEMYGPDHEQSQSYIVSNEADAFGRTVGFQLKELKHIQRVYAEKLISDVIFQARLGNLNSGTTLSSNKLM